MRRPAPALLILATLTGCAVTDQDTASPAGRGVEIRTPCLGIPGKPAGSDSYRPGAPDVAGDGEELIVTVVVYVRENDGTCRVVQDALVEIWHTGDEGRYLDDAWRTARRTAEDGTTSYRTVRPVPETNFPHLHVRVSTSDSAPEDWVVGVTPDTPGELRLELLVGADASTTTTVPAGGPDV